MSTLLYYIYLIPIVASAILSLKAFRLGWPKPFRWLSFFLLLTVAVEVLAVLWKWYWHKTAHWTFSNSNLWIYNGFLPLRYLLLFGFFHGIIVSEKVKTIIRIGAPVFLLLCLYNYFFLQGPDRVDYYTIAICNITCTILSLCFFIQLWNAKDVFQPLWPSEMWVSVGVFIYHIGTLPLFMFFDYWILNHYSMLLSYLYVNDALNIFMYLFFLIAFLCKPLPPK